MKKISIIAVLVVLAATSAIAATVVGSKHDMIASGHATVSGGAADEVCIFCHTPHGGQVSVTQAPLWNNTAVANVGTLYSSTTMNFTVTPAQVNATDARLCLACHDAGVGEPVNLPNSGSLDVESPTTMTANSLIGTNLSNDHPIGMDLGLTPESTDRRYDGEANLKSIGEIIGVSGFDENPFYNGVSNTMWCSTCHDVHDGDPLMAPFLRISNAGSAMCKACHKK